MLANVQKCITVVLDVCVCACVLLLFQPVGRSYSKQKHQIHKHLTNHRQSRTILRCATLHCTERGKGRSCQSAHSGPSPGEVFCNVCFYETEGEYPLDTVPVDVERSSVPFVPFEINDYFLGFAGVEQYVVLRTPLCQLLRPPLCLQIQEQCQWHPFRMCLHYMQTENFGGRQPLMCCRMSLSKHLMTTDVSTTSLQAVSGFLWDRVHGSRHQAG